MTSTVVLVHGAFHGSWCWERVTPLLDDAGVAWRAVDLAGPDLASDGATVRAELDRVDDPVVLVGHSYGGAVISAAGDHPTVTRLVYLAALALDEGETLGSAGGDEARRVVHPSPNLGDVIEFHGATAVLPADQVGPYLYNDCDDATVEWAAARVRPQPSAVFADVAGPPAWRVKPATYAVCTEDRAVPAALQRILALRCSESLEWTTSHSPFASRPDLVAELLVDLAR